MHIEHAKKVMSKSPGIVDFIVTLVNSNFYLLNKQEEIFPAGPVRMTFRLVHCSLAHYPPPPPPGGIMNKSEEKVKWHYTVVYAVVYRVCLNSKPEDFKILFAL